MESLNLNNLASSLPSSSYANAEKELTNNFKGAYPSVAISPVQLSPELSFPSCPLSLSFLVRIPSIVLMGDTSTTHVYLNSPLPSRFHPACRSPIGC